MLLNNWNAKHLIHLKNLIAKRKKSQFQTHPKDMGSSYSFKEISGEN